MNRFFSAVLFVLALTACANAFSQTAAQMGMTEEEHANMHKLPTGTGESAAGAWLIPPTSGVYVIHNGKIHGVTSQAVQLEAGGQYRIDSRGPGAEPLMWTPPGGSKTVVPSQYLIPVDPKNVVKK